MKQALISKDQDSVKGQTIVLVVLILGIVCIIVYFTFIASQINYTGINSQVTKLKHDVDVLEEIIFLQNKLDDLIRNDNYIKYMEAMKLTEHMTDDDRIEFTRRHIKSETEFVVFKDVGYGAEELNDLVPELGGIPVRTLLISTWKSGSSYIGNMLHSLPGDYHHFEPLMYKGMKQIRDPDELQDAYNQISSLFRCNYTKLNSYLNHLNISNQIYYNRRIYPNCIIGNVKQFRCFQPEFLNPLCNLFPFVSMKELRLRLEYIEPLLLDGTVNIKILHLVRDPRAIMDARRMFQPCNTTIQCNNTKIMCDEMISDYNSAVYLTKKYPNRIITIRFEDVAYQREQAVRKFFEHLDRPYHSRVTTYLNHHAIPKEDDGTETFITYKNTTYEPIKWLNTTNFEPIEEIQNICKEVIEIYGYKLLSAEEFAKIRNNITQQIDLYKSTQYEMNTSNTLNTE